MICLDTTKEDNSFNRNQKNGLDERVLLVNDMGMSNIVNQLP